MIEHGLDPDDNSEYSNAETSPSLPSGKLDERSRMFLGSGRLVSRIEIVRKFNPANERFLMSPTLAAREAEFVGLVNSKTEAVSIARMRSPSRGCGACNPRNLARS